ncbi:MAG TPA: hypothetical protein VGO47_13645, partial [Chlamydiales bacterium]|nr:hypothetical protein [Chlamydiales bacterium]
TIAECAPSPPTLNTIADKVQVVLVFRTWAIWGQNKRIGYGLLVAVVLGFAIGMYRYLTWLAHVNCTSEEEILCINLFYVVFFFFFQFSVIPS